MKNFLVESTRLLTTLPTLTGDEARVAHRLCRALQRIEAFTSQAQAQFAVGDSHATFNKQFINSILDEEKD